MSTHTLGDLSRYIGLEVPWSTGNLEVTVRILDCKRAYGRTTYLITPVTGRKSAWVREGLTLPTEGE